VSSRDPNALYAALPLPVATLLLRSRNAKSAKERHDNAYYALEVSVRLAVAARPPADPGLLARASLGVWVQALGPAESPRRDHDLLELFGLLTKVGIGKRAAPETVNARRLLEALSAYRNRTIGHGATRSRSFYEAAVPRLEAGLVAAWREGFFFRPDADFLYVESVQLEPKGGHRARALHLFGLEPVVDDPQGTPVPAHLLPERLYLRRGDSWHDLHPWLLYVEGGDKERETIYFFNGLGKRAEFLDYASGDLLRGSELTKLRPDLLAELYAYFSTPAEEAPETAQADSSDRFGDFTLVGKLGHGGMGTVYLARQESLNRLVALKVLKADQADQAEDLTALTRFQREIDLLSHCEHPNVVKVLASGHAHGA